MRCPRTWSSPTRSSAGGEGETGFGLATAALGFGGLAAPLLARAGRGEAADAARSLACFGVPLALVALTPGVAWAVVPLALAGAASVQVEALATATLQRSTADRHRASVLGIGDTAIVSAALVGSLLGPALVAALGTRPSVALLGLLCALLVADARRMTLAPLPAAHEVAVPTVPVGAHAAP